MSSSGASGGPPPGGDGSGPPPMDPSQLPHDKNIMPSIRAGVWALVALSAAFLALRLYCKNLKHSRLHWDDWVLVASWICLVGDATATTVSMNYGFGEHIYLLPVENINPLNLWGIISVTFSIAGQSWSKTSFAMTLLRISDGWIRYVIWVAVITMNIGFMVGALFFWVTCEPLSKAWNPLTPGKCLDVWINVRYGIFISAYSGVLDLLLAALPWKIIMTLQMKTREKIGVAVAMSMGVFAAITAFVKCSYLPLLASPDFSFEGSNLVIWGAAEIAVTIMAASIPVMRVLIREVVSTRKYRSVEEGGRSKGTISTPSRSNKLWQSDSQASLRSASRTETGGGAHDKPLPPVVVKKGEILRTQETITTYDDKQQPGLAENGSPTFELNQVKAWVASPGKESRR